jgi:hypothetical protein
MPLRASLAGLLSVVVPFAVAAAIALRHAEPAPSTRVWAGWGAPEAESASLLRDAAATGARGAATALARCEREADPADYRRCALTPLAEAAASSHASSAMLLRLASEADPPEACRRVLIGFAGGLSALDQAGTATLHDWQQLSRRELRDTGRAIAALAADARAAAHDPAWRACRPGSDPLSRPDSRGLTPSARA